MSTLELELEKRLSTKPTLKKEDVIKIASVYGIESFMIDEIHSFPSYDDQVFHIDVKHKYINHNKNIFPIIMKCSILRSFHRIDLWIKLGNHLINNNIPTPRPILLLNEYRNKVIIIIHIFIYIIKI